MLPVNAELRRLTQLGGQRVHELGYQTRAVVVGLTEMVGDHARAQRLDVVGNHGLLRHVRRGRGRKPVLAVRRGRVDWSRKKKERKKKQLIIIISYVLYRLRTFRRGETGAVSGVPFPAVGADFKTPRV